MDFLTNSSPMRPPPTSELAESVMAHSVERLVRPGPRTFDHFPEEMICPVCGTNDDGLAVLVPIDGTRNGNIAEAAPAHLACAVGDHLSIRARLIYRQVAPAWTYPPNVPAQRPPAKDV